MIANVNKTKNSLRTENILCPNTIRINIIWHVDVKIKISITAESLIYTLLTVGPTDTLYTHKATLLINDVLNRN